jgi:acyl dehydratase
MFVEHKPVAETEKLSKDFGNSNFFLKCFQFDDRKTNFQTKRGGNMPRTEELQPLGEGQIEQVRKYVEERNKGRAHYQDFMPEGYERTWERLITPELAILYADAVEDYNPWYEAWPSGKGKSPFGPAVAPPLLLSYWFHEFLPEDEGSAPHVGLIHYSHDTRILAPCFIGSLVRFHAKVTQRFVKRGRLYGQVEFRAKDVNTGKLLMKDTTILLLQYKKVSEWREQEMKVVSKETSAGDELVGVRKQAVIQLMGSRHWGRMNPLHWDPVFAAQEGLRAPIQTGHMCSAYLAEMCVNYFGENFFNGARIECKYIKPIFAGDIITTHGMVREKTPEGSGYRLKVELWAENQEGTKVTIGWAEAHVE